MEHSTPSKAYPFRTRRQIATLIQTDREFARGCVEIMTARHVAKDAVRNEHGAMGWGSSDASRVAKPAQRILDGLDTDADWEEALPILARYTKQLAQHFRDRQLMERPELADVAALYGVSVAMREVSAPEPAGPAPCATESQSTAAVDATLPVAPVPHREAVACDAVLQLTPLQAAAHDAVASVPHSEAITCNFAAFEAMPQLGSVEAVTSKALPQLSAVDAVPCEPVAPQLSPVQRAIIAYLTRHERGTTTEIAEQTRKDRAAVLEALRQLHEQGTIFRAGVGRGTFYSLRPQ